MTSYRTHFNYEEIKDCESLQNTVLAKGQILSLAGAVNHRIFEAATSDSKESTFIN